MERGGSGAVVFAKIDPCGTRDGLNCVKCKSCKKWVHARGARVKRVSCRMNGNFECRVCMNASNELCKNAWHGCLHRLERVNISCYLREKMNSGGRSELAVTRRIKLDWKAEDSMSSMLCDKRHTWNIKKNL